MLPAGLMEPGGVGSLDRRPVGLGSVIVDLPGVADGLGDQLSEFGDRNVRSGADVDPVGWVGDGQEVEAGGGEVIDVEELAAGRAAAPNRDARGAGEFGFVESPQERGEDVAVLGVIVVARTVEVGRHGGVEHHAVLLAVVLAHLQAGDLGDRVGFVCWL